MKMKSLSYETYLNRKKVRKVRKTRIQTERKFCYAENQESFIESVLKTGH